MRSPKSVGIAGLGLVGGSLARALAQAGYRVLGFDPLAHAAHKAIRRRSRLADLVVADTIVLAASPRVNLGLLRQLAVLAPTAVITDVGSVKRPICAEAARLGLRHFVGGHPMAGNAGSGFRASRPDLFVGRPWILTGGEPSAERQVRRLVRATGARPVSMSAADHDRTLAFLSHVPQLVAWALVQAAQADPVARAQLAVAGPGWRDMTRLAASPRPLWREVLEQNRAQVKRALRALRRSLTALLAELPPPRARRSGAR